MKPDRAGRILRRACISGLSALGLMVWSLFDPRPIPVILAMSAGQVLGTVSLGALVYVVVADLRSRMTRRPQERAPRE